MTPYQASLELIEIRTAPRGTALVRLHNAQAWRDKFAALKPLKPKGIIAARVRDPRTYPREPEVLHETIDEGLTT